MAWCHQAESHYIQANVNSVLCQQMPSLSHSELMGLVMTQSIYIGLAFEQHMTPGPSGLRQEMEAIRAHAIIYKEYKDPNHPKPWLKNVVCCVNPSAYFCSTQPRPEASRIIWFRFIIVSEGLLLFGRSIVEGKRLINLASMLLFKP